MFIFLTNNLNNNKTGGTSMKSYLTALECRPPTSVGEGRKLSSAEARIDMDYRCISICSAHVIIWTSVHNWQEIETKGEKAMLELNFEDFYLVPLTPELVDGFSALCYISETEYYTGRSARAMFRKNWAVLQFLLKYVRNLKSAGKGKNLPRGREVSSDQPPAFTSENDSSEYARAPDSANESSPLRNANDNTFKAPEPPFENVDGQWVYHPDRLTAAHLEVSPEIFQSTPYDERKRQAVAIFEKTLREKDDTSPLLEKYRSLTGQVHPVTLTKPTSKFRLNGKSEQLKGTRGRTKPQKDESTLFFM